MLFKQNNPTKTTFNSLLEISPSEDLLCEVNLIKIQYRKFTMKICRKTLHKQLYFFLDRKKNTINNRL